MKHTKKVILLMLLLSSLATNVIADFTTTGYQQRNIANAHTSGRLYDYSLVNIDRGAYVNTVQTYDESTLQVKGYPNDLSIYFVYAYNKSKARLFSGEVNRITAYHSSSTEILGGEIMAGLYSYDDSSIDVTGGSVYRLGAYDFSCVSISGGSIGSFGLMIADNSTVTISGGTTNQIYAYNNSTTIFNGEEFILGSGLSWGVDGKTILGTGILSGRWVNGTSWSTNISIHDTTATITTVPEPASLLLLGLGGVILRRKK